MSIPTDAARNIIWRFLPYRQILEYCKTDESMKSICDDPEAWRYLLKRDYSIFYYGDDSKYIYRLLHDNKDLIAKIEQSIVTISTMQGPFYRGIDPITGRITLVTGTMDIIPLEVYFQLKVYIV